MHEQSTDVRVAQMPVAVFALCQLRGRSLQDFHASCLSLMEGLTLTLFATDTLKYAAGRYRPDWYDSWQWCSVARQ
jgi:hypothetical protein